MIRIYCDNENCERFGIKFPMTNAKFVFRYNKLVPSNLPKCPVCGIQVSYEEEKNETVPDISIGEFKMMSTENKAKMLKKRANDFSKKDGSEDRKRFYQEKTNKNVLNYK